MKISHVLYQIIYQNDNIKKKYIDKLLFKIKYS